MRRSSANDKRLVLFRYIAHLELMTDQHQFSHLTNENNS